MTERNGFISTPIQKKKKGKEKINIQDIFKINTLFKIKIMKYVIKSSYILFEM